MNDPSPAGATATAPGGSRTTSPAAVTRPRKILGEKIPQDQAIIAELKTRCCAVGGSGFLTGPKWSFMPRSFRATSTSLQPDEGDPGPSRTATSCATTPHSVIEGMAIAAYAVGRAGQLHPRRDLRDQAALRGGALRRPARPVPIGQQHPRQRLLFELFAHHGYGAYICGGEETALPSRSRARRPAALQSRLPGRVSACTANRPRSTTPRPRPSRSSEHGRRGLPEPRQAQQRRQ